MKNVFLRTQLFAICLVIVGCATQPIDSKEDRLQVVQQAKNVFSVPLNIGKLSLSRKITANPPVFGTAYSYQGDMALNATVYIYSAPFSYSTVTVRGERFNGYIADFVKEIRFSEEAGIYTDVTIDEISGVAYVSSQYGILPIARVTMQLERNNQKLNSTAYLTGIANHVVKIRVTYPDYYNLQKNMDWFARKFIYGLYVVTVANGKTIALLPPLPDDKENFDFQAYLRQVQMPGAVRKVRNNALHHARIDCPELKRENIASAICYENFDVVEPITPFD